MNREEKHYLHSTPPLLWEAQYKNYNCVSTQNCTKSTVFNVSSQLTCYCTAKSHFTDECEWLTINMCTYACFANCANIFVTVELVLVAHCVQVLLRVKGVVFITWSNCRYWKWWKLAWSDWVSCLQVARCRTILNHTETVLWRYVYYTSNFHSILYNAAFSFCSKSKLYNTDHWVACRKSSHDGRDMRKESACFTLPSAQYNQQESLLHLQSKFYFTRNKLSYKRFKYYWVVLKCMGI